MEHWIGLAGIATLIGIAFLFSPAKSKINWRTVGAGVLLQFAIAVLVLKVPGVISIFDGIARIVTRVISFADEGINFLFGKLGDPSGPWGFIFAFRVLPIIVFFASFMAVLYHLGIMQRVVAVVAIVLRKTLGITGVEALSAAANVFLGQTEAPLTVLPYIPKMTKSQIMTIMTGGFATIAGSVLAAYVGLLGGDDEASRVLFAKHLLCASVISSAAAFVTAKIMLPETQTPIDESFEVLTKTKRDTLNVVDAAAAGATEGLKLALNVAAMLVAFVAMIALVNYPLTAFSEWAPIAQWRAAHELPLFTLQNLMGFLFTPIAWLMGIEGQDVRKAGALLGTQVIATEFVAYLDLAGHVRNETISPRSAQIMTYALCGFANLPSIAIQIGGFSAMAPERRAEFATIAPRACLAGALACWMTACVAGLMIS